MKIQHLFVTIVFVLVSACAPQAAPATGTALPPDATEAPAAPTEGLTSAPVESLPTPGVTPSPLQEPEDLCDIAVLQAALDKVATEQVGYATSWFQVTYAEKTEDGCAVVAVPGYQWTKSDWDNQLKGLITKFVPLSKKYPYVMFAYTYVEDSTFKWLWLSDMLVYPEKQDPALTLLAIVLNIDPKEVISMP